MEDNCKLLSGGQTRKSNFEGNPMSAIGVMLSLNCLCAMQTDTKQTDITNLKLKKKDKVKERNLGVIILPTWCLKLLYSKERNQEKGVTGT